MTAVSSIVNVHSRIEDIYRVKGTADIKPMCTAVGKDAREVKDACQAVIGELAHILYITYDDFIMAEFASEIGLDPDTVRGYRRVVALFGGRAVYVESMLAAGASWSVIKEAQNHYPRDAAKALAFIDRAVQETMSVREARRAIAIATGKPIPRKTVMEGECEVGDVDTVNGTVKLKAKNGSFKMANMKGATVMVKVTIEAQPNVVAAAVRGAGDAVSEAEAGR